MKPIDAIFWISGKQKTATELRLPHYFLELESVWFKLNQTNQLKVLIILRFMQCLRNKQNMKRSSG